MDNTELISEVKSTSFGYVNAAIYPANGRFTTEASRKTGNRADVYDYPHASYSETAIGVACLPLKAKGRWKSIWLSSRSISTRSRSTTFRSRSPFSLHTDR